MNLSVKLFVGTALWALVSTCFGQVLHISGNVWVNVQNSTGMFSIEQVDNIASPLPANTASEMRAEVWGFPTPYTGGRQTGTMLFRYVLGNLPGQYRMNDIVSPSFPITVPQDGAYHLAVLIYSRQFCVSLNPSACNPDQVSVDTIYSTHAMRTFANLTGSLRCSQSNCSTSSRPPAALVPQTGWWWNPDESGRGLSIEVSGNNLFMAFYLYDSTGERAWYTAAGVLGEDGLFSAPLQEFSGGQTLTGGYKAPTIINNNVGTISIQFSDSTNAVLTLPDGRRVPITRFRF